jgi:hypothetical protein
LSQEEDSGRKLVELIETANDDEIEAALLALGRKWKTSKQNAVITGRYNPSLDSAIAV